MFEKSARRPVAVVGCVVLVRTAARSAPWDIGPAPRDLGPVSAGKRYLYS